MRTVFWLIRCARDEANSHNTKGAKSGVQESIPSMLSHGEVRSYPQIQNGSYTKKRKGEQLAEDPKKDNARRHPQVG